MKQEYLPQEIEEKWQRRWAAEKTFEVCEDRVREKFYCLEMLAYTSGRAHMGHVSNYSIGDALSWYKRMRGYNVLHPFGWDAFGQPAETAAIKDGTDPEEFTRTAIATMKSQLRRMGMSYDWSREIATCDPEYYRWNQWFFIRMFERGMLYRKLSPVNWCPKEEISLCERTSLRRSVLAMRNSGRSERVAAVVCAYHRLRRRVARRIRPIGRPVARPGHHNATQLDRPLVRRTCTV